MKKVVALMLALGMLTCLVGCGEKKEEPTPDTGVRTQVDISDEENIIVDDEDIEEVEKEADAEEVDKEDEVDEVDDSTEAEEEVILIDEEDNVSGDEGDVIDLDAVNEVAEVDEDADSTEAGSKSSNIVGQDVITVE